MKKTNPFPGMNPWLEEHWPGVHSLLISAFSTQLSLHLPEDLMARPEEGVSISALGDQDHFFRADVAVTESWKDGVAPAWSPPSDADLEARAALPTIVQVAPMTERWIEIRDAAGKLITVIEILSPSNKGVGLAEYTAKRKTLMASPINVVEIDLLLNGQVLFPDIEAVLSPIGATHYFINIKRMGALHRRELHRPLLREPLPVIRIPLRPGEKDVFIDLQPLINQVHTAGRYHMLDYQSPPAARLPLDDQAWLQECLAAS
jgi:hypothetical protein